MLNSFASPALNSKGGGAANQKRVDRGSAYPGGGQHMCWYHPSARATMLDFTAVLAAGDGGSDSSHAPPNPKTKPNVNLYLHRHNQMLSI